MQQVEDIFTEVGYNKDLSNQYNLEQRALDNNWLYDKVQQGWLTQQAFVELQAMKDILQHMYPDLWDLQITVVEVKVTVEWKKDVPDRVDHMGVYFGYEPIAPGEYGVDENPYYLWNYEGRMGRIYYTPEQAKLYRKRDDDSDWHVLPDKIRVLYFNMIVKFPEVEISDDINKHIIKDLYFSLQYRPRQDGIAILVQADRNNLSAMPSRVGETFTIPGTIIQYQHTRYYIKQEVRSARESITPLEYHHKYLHSHSTRRDLEYYTEFGVCCLGGGEINETFLQVGAEFTPEMFNLLLFQLDAYSKWESRAGGPYIEINTLKSGKKIAEYPNYSVETYWGHIKDYIKNNSEDIDLDWNITSDKKLEIVDNYKLQNFCKLPFGNNPDSYPDNACIFYKDGEGGIFMRKRAELRINPPSAEALSYAPPIIFKGQNVPLKIINPPVEEINEVYNSDFIVNPNITNYIKKLIENHANFEKAKYDITQRISATINQSRNTRENPVLL